jgi:glyoxylase-like metal-dependent hydrolase (beta-lactamase superfamily II)
METPPHWKTPIRDVCFMVGRRDPDSLLQCNTYLRTFHAPGSPKHWCVDPGSRLDYPEIRRHLLEHIGAMTSLKMFSINHQDPDIVGNLPRFTHENPRLTGLVSEDTWRLVRHLNAQPKRLCFTNKVKEGMVQLLSGQKIQVVPTPFCHFRGAMALYDPETQILFSGDLFGGLNAPGRVQLFAEEADWAGIAQFHQIYMPAREAVAHAIRQVRALRPAVKVIAPQHGFVLQGDFMHEVLDLLEELEVGLDLLPLTQEKRYLRAYQEVLDELIAQAGEYWGHAEVVARLRALPKHHELQRYLKVTRKAVVLRDQGLRALPLVIDALAHDQFEEVRSQLKDCVLQGCTVRKLPLPQLGVGLGESDRAMPENEV